jgi:hypothetical protein
MKSPSKRQLNAEAIARLKEIGLDRINITDVVETLRQNGIHDLEQLVSAQMEVARTQIDKPEGLGLYTTRAKTSTERAAAIVHRSPHMPVLIDGVLHDPKDINRFDGQPLHFVSKTAEDGTPVLQAFTGNQWTTALNTYFQIRDMLSTFDFSPTEPFGPYQPQPIPPLPPYPQPQPPFTPFPPIGPFSPHPPAMPPPPPPPPTESQFFSDINFEGDWLWLGRRLAWNDLTRVNRAKVLFFSGDWNDVISSLRTWVGTVTLYEHINQGGSTLTFPPGKHIPDLRSYGWNDRVSSIVNWG